MMLTPYKQLPPPCCVARLRAPLSEGELRCLEGQWEPYMLLPVLHPAYWSSVCLESCFFVEVALYWDALDACNYRKGAFLLAAARAMLITLPCLCFLFQC